MCLVCYAITSSYWRPRWPHDRVNRVTELYRRSRKSWKCQGNTQPWRTAKTERGESNSWSFQSRFEAFPFTRCNSTSFLNYFLKTPIYKSHNLYQDNSTRFPHKTFPHINKKLQNKLNNFFKFWVIKMTADSIKYKNSKICLKFKICVYFLNTSGGLCVWI